MDSLFTRAKGPYLRTADGRTFYDLRKPTTIFGHSDPKITASYKDAVSSCWDLDLPTVHHKRLEGLLRLVAPQGHALCVFHGAEHFYLKMADYFGGVTSVNTRQEEFLKKKGIHMGQGITACDMAWLYLMDQSPETDGNRIYDYYYYPYGEIEALDMSADLVVLPWVLTGCTDLLLVFVNTKFGDFIAQSAPLSSIRAADALLILNNYYRAKKVGSRRCFVIKNNDFIARGRLFSYADCTPHVLTALYERFYQQGVILAKEPPYYSYLPLILDDNQVMRLKRTGL